MREFGRGESLLRWPGNASTDSDCASDRGREEQVLFERKDTGSAEWFAIPGRLEVESRAPPEPATVFGETQIDCFRR